MPAVPLTAADMALGFDTIERLKYYTLPDGSTARRVVEVEAGDAIVCDNKDMDLQEIILRGTVKTGPMEYADQIVIVTP